MLSTWPTSRWMKPRLSDRWSNASVGRFSARSRRNAFMSAQFGELVNHVHFYVLPRYADMPRDGLEVLRLMFGAEAPFACGDDAAAAAAEKVRAALS